MQNKVIISNNFFYKLTTSGPLYFSLSCSLPFALYWISSWIFSENSILCSRWLLGVTMYSDTIPFWEPLFDIITEILQISWSSSSYFGLSSSTSSKNLSSLNWPNFYDNVIALVMTNTLYWLNSLISCIWISLKCNFHPSFSNYFINLPVFYRLLSSSRISLSTMSPKLRAAASKEKQYLGTNLWKESGREMREDILFLIMGMRSNIL